VPKSKPKSPAPAAGFRTVHARWIILLAVLVCVAYANSIGAGLAFDNKVIIRGDSRTQAATWENVRQIFTTNYWYPRPGVEYRPFTTLTYMFNYAVLGGGTNPVGYNLLNLFLHWLNAALVYLLMREIWSRAVPAFLAGAVFALHPVATESVTNVVGRADLLATACVLGGLLIYIRIPRHAPEGRGRRLAALAAVAAVGAFSKESATALPLVILLYDLVFRLEKHRQGGLANIATNVWGSFRRGAWAAALPVALFWAVRARVFAGLPKPWIPFLDNPLAHADFWTSRATAVKVFGKYLGLLAWPATLSCDYSYNQIPFVALTMRRAQDWLAVVALAAILSLLGLAAWCLRRGRGDIFFFIAFFFVTLAPVANFVFPIGTIMAERLLYLPLVGFAGFAVAAVEAAADRFPASRRQRAFYAAMAVLLAAACVRTILRNRDWATEERVFLSGVETSPNSYKMHFGAASVLSYADPQRNIDRIIAEAETARAILAGVPPEELDSALLVNLGMFYRTKGDGFVRSGAADAETASAPWYEKSAAALLEAAQAAARVHERERRRSAAATVPFNSPEIWMNLAATRARQRRFEDAHQAHERAIAAAPGRADVYVAAARLDFTTARPEHGLAMLHAALIVRPGDPDALSLLRKVYREVDPQGCAVSADLGAQRSACPPVQHFRCAGYGVVARAHDALPAPDAARQLRARAAQAGCPPSGP
jgi:hypothetical protein